MATCLILTWCDKSEYKVHSEVELQLPKKDFTTTQVPWHTHITYVTVGNIVVPMSVNIPESYITEFTYNNILFTIKDNKLFEYINSFKGERISLKIQSLDKYYYYINDQKESVTTSTKEDAAYRIIFPDLNTDFVISHQ